MADVIYVQEVLAMSAPRAHQLLMRFAPYGGGGAAAITRYLDNELSEQDRAVDTRHRAAAYGSWVSSFC